MDSFRIMAVSKMQMTRGGWRPLLASLWIFGEILHAISCLTALICLALFWVMFRIKVWARKWALKRDKIYKKTYSQRRGRSQAEISSWQSNKSVKITHLLSWHTKEGLFYFLTLLLWLSDVIYQNIISYFPGDGENSQDNGTPSHLLRSL